MELFYRRYLCFFAFLFLAASVLALTLSDGVKIAAISLLLALSLIAFVLIFIVKKHRFVMGVIFTSILFSFIALLNSYIFISQPKERAEKYFGTTAAAQIRILSIEYSDKDSSQYSVRVERIDSDAPDIKAYLYCDFPADLDYGDKMIGEFDFSEPSNYIDQGADALLCLYVGRDAPVLYKEAESASYFSFDGILRISEAVRESFGEYCDSVFGESSGIIKGFLIDDRSDIPSYVQNDFRRSGTTHLLAVSGMHIVVLLGSLDFLLKKIYVAKKARCVVISLGALLLLFLTGFAGSAVRSVLMLYCVYLSYLFYEDHDTVTSLFVSAFLIVLISPFSVFDIGMWMSFFATLGLVTVYSYFDKKLPRPKKQKGIKRLLMKLLLYMLRAILITLVANFFLLPVMWMFFGEISLSALGANLILSPIVGVFMPFCAIAVMIGMIPGINTALVFVAQAFESVIFALADFFGNIRGAVLSLNYPFVTWLIIAFAVSMSILLTVKLKRKLWVCAPPIAFVLAFCVCLAVFNISSSPKLRQAGDEENKLLFFDDGAKSLVCDLSDGGYRASSLYKSNKNPYATEIESYVIISPCASHASSVRSITYDAYIRNLYIPKPRDIEEAKNILAILEVAAQYGCEVEFYESGEGIELFKTLIE